MTKLYKIFITSTGINPQQSWQTFMYTFQGQFHNTVKNSTNYGTDPNQNQEESRMDINFYKTRK